MTLRLGSISTTLNDPQSCRTASASSLCWPVSSRSCRNSKASAIETIWIAVLTSSSARTSTITSGHLLKLWLLSKQCERSEMKWTLMLSLRISSSCRRQMAFQSKKSQRQSSCSRNIRGKRQSKLINWRKQCWQLWPKTLEVRTTSSSLRQPAKK